MASPEMPKPAQWWPEPDTLSWVGADKDETDEEEDFSEA